MGSMKIVTVGNPAMRVPEAKGPLLPTTTILGALPGVSAFATHIMNQEMEALDVPPIPEFIEIIYDASGKICACEATVVHDAA